MTEIPKNHPRYESLVTREQISAGVDKDCGEQYRTGIYYTDEADLPVIQTAVSVLEKQIGMMTAIEVKPLENYYLAEEFHQDFLKKNPGGYCHIPKALFEKVKDARE